MVIQAERGSWQHLLWYKAIRVLIYLAFLWLKSRFLIEIVRIVSHETKRPPKHHMSQQRDILHMYTGDKNPRQDKKLSYLPWYRMNLDV